MRIDTNGPIPDKIAEFDSDSRRVSLYSKGFEIATYDPQSREWFLRVDGHRVSLAAVRRGLEALEGRLEDLRPRVSG